jgi:hypothetical protein
MQNRPTPHILDFYAFVGMNDDSVEQSTNVSEAIKAWNTKDFVLCTGRLREPTDV